MIAEGVVDLGSGTLSIVLVGTLLVVAALGGMGYAGIKAAIGRLDEKVVDLAKAVGTNERAAQKHRHDDASMFQDAELRFAKIEHALERDGLLTPVRDTGPHDRLRGNTPQPRRHEDTGDTGSGMHER